MIVEARSGATTGLGWTYAAEAAAHVVEDTLAGVVRGRSTDELGAIWLDCGAALRNIGRPGIAWCALSAVDIALWDLHARLLDVPLTSLLPACHDRVPVYGSGGFCSYSLERIAEQLGGWVEQGIPRVKMKLGRDPDADPGAPRRGARGDRRRRALRRRERCVLGQGGASLGAALRGATGTCAGSRSRSRRTTSRACAWSASRRRSMSPPASTPTSRPTSATWSARSTASRPTSPAAAASPGCMRANGLAVAHGLDLSGTLRTPARGARVLRRRPAAPPRVLPRPRAHRVDALRRRARAGRRRARPGPLAAGPRSRVEARRGAAVGRVIGRLLENIAAGPRAEAAGRDDRDVRARPRARDLLRALQGLVRRQVDVDAARADAAADGCRRRRVRLREGGANGAARRLRAVLPGRPRRDRHAHPGRAQAPRRLQGSPLQPDHGAAAARARARSAWSAGSGSPRRSSSANDEDAP